MEETSANRDRLKKEILDIVSRCVKCRFCFTQCPVYEVSNKWTIQGGSGITQSLYYGIKFGRIDEDLRDILMRCTTCRSCEIICDRLMSGVALVNAIKLGRQLLFEDQIPPNREHQNVLENLQKVGNPYGKQPSKRTSWADDLGLSKLTDVADTTTLYYVGCTPSYDDRASKVAQSIAKILKEAGLHFGILENEKCSGDTALTMGEFGLFEMLAYENIDRLKKIGIKTIFTTSPHDFNCFLKEYPEGLKEIKVMHYIQLFSDLINQRRMKFKNEFKKRVTFHDPCYLGKHHGIYEEPRRILKSIPGLDLVEMERNRENSLCCGGGGGRMWVDFEEDSHLAEVRVLEALNAGAEILATACPYCLINFESAIKTLDKEDVIAAKDISEILSEAIFS
jgi:Fe-S oxidoreductase